MMANSVVEASVIMYGRGKSLGMSRMCRTVVAGRYPASRQLAFGREVFVFNTVRQKKAMVHTPWKIWRLTRLVSVKYL